MGCVHAKANDARPPAVQNLPSVVAAPPSQDMNMSRNSDNGVAGLKEASHGPAQTQRRDSNPGSLASKNEARGKAVNTAAVAPGCVTIKVPGSNYSLRYACLSQRGYYPEALDKENQDAFCVHTQFGNDPDSHFFGVFDGHGEYGTPCAQFACTKLPENLQQHRSFQAEPTQAYHSAFVTTNAQLHRHSTDDSMSGTTGITVLVRGRNIYCANVGDSRAVIAERRGKQLVAVDLSQDQTPFRPDECARVKMSGARVLTLDQLEGLKNSNVQCWGGEEDDDGDPPRLWVPNGMYPGTAFTRSIGDTVAERIGVVAVPEVLFMELTECNPFFVIASDGVFEFLTSQAVIDLVAKFEDPHDACAATVAESYRRWLQYETRTDDITIIIVQVIGLSAEPTREVEKEAEGPKSPTPVQSRSAADSGQDTPDNDKFVPVPAIRPVRRMLSRARRRAIEGMTPAVTDLPTWAPNKDMPPKTAEERAKLEQAVKINFLFNHLSEKQLEVLYSCMEPVNVQPGDIIIRQGDMGDRCYIVNSGEYEVLVATGGGDSGELGAKVHHYTYKTNPCFGELALIYNKPREATVRATTEGSLWALEQAAFRHVVMTQKPSRRSVLAALRGVPILSTLSMTQLQRLADAVSEVAFRTAEVIVRPEDEMERFSVVASGEVSITAADGTVVAGRSAVPHDRAEQRPTQYFGESVLGLPSRLPQRLRVVALGDVLCLNMSREVFEGAVGPLPQIIAEDQRLRAAVSSVQKHLHAQLSLDRLSHTNMDDIEWQECVYSTHCCEVGRVRLRETGDEMSMKRYSRRRVESLGLLGHVRRERSLLSSLSPSPWVAPVVATCSSKSHAAILLHVRLSAPLSVLIQQPLPEAEARFYAASVILALELLHKDSVVYRAVSADMLVLDDRGYVQLVDFRFAKRLSDGRTYTTCGMPEYLAPEIIGGQGHAQAADWWALGILVFALLHGETPFGTGKDDLDLFRRIATGKIEYPGHFSPSAVDLLTKLLVLDENKRLGCDGRGVEVLKQHPWFEGTDWEGLMAGRVDAPSVAMERLRMNSQLPRSPEAPHCLESPRREEGAWLDDW